MKTREIFENVRSQRNNHLSLRVRLTLLVSCELVTSILLALGLYFLLEGVIPLNSALLLLLDLIIISLTIGAVVTSFMSKLFFDPIKKLTLAMEKVADGDFSVRLMDKSSSQEIMEIYSGFNLMAHELSATEILQTDFVSNVSHEFKTPINAIEGYSTLLQGSDNLNADQQNYVEKIVFNTKRLSTLVGSILLLSKLENQQISTGQTRYRLDEQIRQSIVAMEDAWVEKDIELDVDMDRIDYLGNENMMRHIWDNLIGNAIKFSPQSGTVWIRLTQQDQTVQFTVQDCGPGIPEEAKKRIFDKFYQADSSHKQEGNGLGLALAKRIVTIAGGEISAENVEAGGCRFTVTLKNQ